MSKPNTNSLTPYQRAATEWLLWRPGLVSCTVNFDQAKKPDKIDRWLVLNVPHYAEVLCKALKIPVEEGGKICRITNCGQLVENPNLDICNRCLEEITAGEEDRNVALIEAIMEREEENQHDEKEDR